MASRVPFVLAALLLAAPMAGAAASSGEFVVTGGARFPAGASHDFHARAAYLSSWGSDGFQAFTLHAERLRVWRYEETQTEVRVGPETPGVKLAPTGNASYELTNVTVELLEGDSRGWIALYFPAEGGRLSLAAPSPVTLVVNASTRLGEGFSSDQATRPLQGQSGEPAHDQAGFRWSSEEPLVFVEAEGILRQEGTGAMKLQGPDLRFSSRENTTEIRTGWEQQNSGGPVPTGERVDRWFYMEYENATLSVGSPAEMRIASSSAHIDWSGAAYFTPVSGNMKSAGSVYEATGSNVRVTGDLSADVEPDPSFGERPALRLSLQGDLRDTTLQRAQGSAQAPVGINPRGWAWMVGLAVALVLLAVAAVLVGRRVRAGALSLEDRVALAHLAAEGKRYREALQHVRVARARAPNDPRLLMEEASYLGALGEVEAALGLYEKASKASPDGDAEFQAGLLLLQEGDPARAEGFLAKALRRSPILVLEVIYDSGGTFDAVRGRAAFERAVEAAQIEVEGG